MTNDDNPEDAGAYSDNIVRVGKWSFLELQFSSSARLLVSRAAGSAAPSARNRHTYNLAEAQAMLPIRISLPAWIPEGFVMSGDSLLVMTPETMRELVRGTAFPDTKIPEVYSATIQWTLHGEAYFVLRILYRPNDEIGLEPIPIAPGGVQELLINGTAYPFVTGVWGQGSGAQGVSRVESQILIWEIDGVEYRLEARPEHLSQANLVRVAESMTTVGSQE